MPPESDGSSSASETSESENEDPQKKLVDLARCEREHSEDNIPKMELAKRIRERELRENNACTSEEMPSASDVDSEATVDYDLTDSILIEEIKKYQAEDDKVDKNGLKSKKKTKKGRNVKFSTLFSAIANMF